MMTEMLRKALVARKAERQFINRDADPKSIREMENLIADFERENTILEYIAACDYPEVFEDEEETENE